MQVPSRNELLPQGGRMHFDAAMDEQEQRYTYVWVTGGGTHYDRDRDCPALAAGQNKAEDDGFAQRKGSSVARTSAEAEGRLACVVCLPALGSTASSPTW